MRTTIRIDDALLKQAKNLAAETSRSLTAVIEDALREVIGRRKMTTSQRDKFRLPAFKGRGLRPGIDLDNSAGLLDLMEDRQ
ncbi:MAG TPA: type II toxin-antitoxin system VapB family antitoxin [Bryobacteraceae bacterium]|jgi:predicted transcriptional regulator|nr:type II toxin-antitoxin system VapB family antitoxin [Bryobacteraceae bacterium]